MIGIDKKRHRQLKDKKCRWCKQLYIPATTLQVACTPQCALAYSRKKREQKQQQETREQKKLLRDTDRAWWLKRAQQAFNAYIRARDAGLPCISCGVPDGQGKRNAGHYRPAGVNSALRFDPANVHGQCERCNTYLSGNLVAYRIGLIAKIGQHAVEALDANHEQRRWTIDELKSITAQYRAMLKSVQDNKQESPC